ncbi:MAG: SMP-30/gluconolactonase/LRE family protein [Aeromicrobium sp.]
MKWETVPAPVGQLYEGPHWIPDVECFQWVDILGATVHRWDPYAAGQVEIRATGLEFATMALPVDDNRSIVASRQSLHMFEWDTGCLSLLGEWAFEPDIRFNDGAVSPDGSIFVGTMSMERRPGAAALYEFNLDTGTLTAVVDGVGISNGLAWTSASDAIYVDSLRPGVDRLHRTGGEIARSAFARLEADDEPDGLAVEADGTVLVAIWGGSRIVRIGGDGTPISSLPIPARYPTSVALGGRQRDLLLVTTAACETSTEGTADGSVLLARDGIWRTR